MSRDVQVMRYLLIEVAGQTFALPMSSVISVHLLDGSTAADTSTTSLRSDALLTFDLGRFLGAATYAPCTYAVILATPTHLCAFMAGGIRPVSTVSVDTLLPLPNLITQLKLPFSGVVEQGDSLIPVIDPDLFLQLVQRLSPDFVVERSYAP